MARLGALASDFQAELLAELGPSATALDAGLGRLIAPAGDAIPETMMTIPRDHRRRPGAVRP